MTFLSGEVATKVFLSTACKEEARAFYAWADCVGIDTNLIAVLPPLYGTLSEPIGKDSAIERLLMHTASYPKTNNACVFVTTLYLERTDLGIWAEKLALMVVWRESSGRRQTLYACGQFGNLVPHQFAPTRSQARDLRICPLNIGVQVRQSFRCMPMQEWALYVEAFRDINVSKSAQMFDALRMMQWYPVELNQ
jgi:hypothetical protein